MLILEFSQYDKYLSDEEFMKFFNSVKNKVAGMYPQINPNLELVIDKIAALYADDYEIDDVINSLYFDGHILQFTNISQP